MLQGFRRPGRGPRSCSRALRGSSLYPRPRNTVALQRKQLLDWTTRPKATCRCIAPVGFTVEDRHDWGVAHIPESGEIEGWVEGVLSGARARAGGVVVLDRADIDQYGDIAELVAVVSSRGWHAVESGNAVVVFCHRGSVRSLR